MQIRLCKCYQTGGNPYEQHNASLICELCNHQNKHVRSHQHDGTSRIWRMYICNVPSV